MPKESKLLLEKAYKAIKQKIIDFDLRPGMSIVENEIAKELDISRTPVREALRRLQEEGLVLLTPYRGAVVKSIDEQDLEEIYNIREALEGMMAGLAAERIEEDHKAELSEILDLINEAQLDLEITKAFEIDNRIHPLLWQASKNGRAEQYLSTLVGQIHRIRAISATSSSRIEQSLDEHKEIIEAVLAGEAMEARRIMEDHIHNAYLHAMKLLSVFGNPIMF